MTPQNQIHLIEYLNVRERIERTLFVDVALPKNKGTCQSLGSYLARQL